MLTQQELKKYLHYDPKSGIFTHNVVEQKSGRIARFGKRAGCRSGKYEQIELLGVNYYSHHLAWFYMTGQWPEKKLDHKDGNPFNNSFGNLRLATDVQNAQNHRIRSNNTSGITGVYTAPKGRWRAYITVNKDHRFLGNFDRKEDAIEARKAAEEKYFGEYARKE
jgi:hypothetical protein